MITPNFTDLKAIFIKKKYPFCAEDGKYNLCIVGIRSNESQSNKFDDKIGVAYKNESMVSQMEWFDATTDPGKYYLQSPLDREGTLILVPNHYHGVYQIGIHGRNGKNPYEALEQYAPMVYVRDNNRDMTLDFDLYRDPGKFKLRRVMGNFKTNLHRASRYQIVQLIDQYGAGCQVIQKVSDFEHLMDLAHKQVDAGHGHFFSYTLLEEKDLKI